jgi:hypothetical protein
MRRRPNIAVFTAVTTASHAVLFLATALGLRVFPVDLGAVAWSHEFYFDHASKAMAGQVPYRDFMLEYPALTFPLFLFPRLFASDLATFRVFFVTEMLLFDAWAIFLIAGHVARSEGIGRVPGRLGWYTLYAACLSPLLIGRFELAPMALGFAAAIWWFSGRNALGGVTAGLGALMKVFPGLVAVPALVWEVARTGAARARGTIAFLATVVIGTAAWFALGGGRVRESIGYQAARGLEVESLYAGALLLAGKLTGAEPTVVFIYKAYHVAGAWCERLAVLSLTVQAAAVLLVAWRFMRSGIADGVRYSGAAVLAFVVAGKVLSPQFLIWLFPFVTVLGGGTGRLARRIFLLACVCTAMIYPGPGFNMLLDRQLGAILFLNLRNALLLWLLALLLFGAGAEEPPRAQATEEVS